MTLVSALACERLHSLPNKHRTIDAIACILYITLLHTPLYFVRSGWINNAEGVVWYPGNRNTSWSSTTTTFASHLAANVNSFHFAASTIYTAVDGRRAMAYPLHWLGSGGAYHTSGCLDRPKD